MNKEIKIIVADDHPLLSQGVIQILSTKDNLKVVGQADNGKTALDLIRRELPDIAILDVQMPEMDGFEVAKIVRHEKLPTKIIFLTMFNQESFIRKVFEIGVKGYILKDSAVADILKCIDAVSENNFYLSPQVSHFLLSMNVKEKSSSKDELTQSEKRILKLIGQGKSSKEIAEELFISIKTVENHRSNICKKLNISGNSALLKYALKLASTLN
ncbi:MAG: two component LuxR family transcriptional regulator [Stygiobacter sp.]|nr:MAG: two component LuxR family transcriptional regulator [Stygiobacter sp.]